jgi:hypothetical protein
VLEPRATARVPRCPTGAHAEDVAAARVADAAAAYSGAAPPQPLLEASSCFLGLRAEYVIVQGLFCKADDARPILTIHTLDAMVGRSWQRGHVPRPRY